MTDKHDPDVERPAEQTREALEHAMANVKTPDQADRVLERLERASEGDTEQQVAEQLPSPDADQAAQEIERTAEATARLEDVIAEIAAQIAAAENEEDEEVLSEGVQRATNPELKSIKRPETEQERRLMQEALLRRLKPLQAADTALFILINNMPHPRIVNDLMFVLTTAMNRGDGWVAGLIVATLRDHSQRRALYDVLPSLWLTTATVEVPIKKFFRRKRPFISIVRAIVVGKKPGNYSFPSGHSAAAFAGAWLLSHHYPRWTPGFYALASLIGFSRVYLGAHYPGDVLSGALCGTALAEAYRYLVRELADAID